LFFPFFFPFPPPSADPGDVSQRTRKVPLPLSIPPLSLLKKKKTCGSFSFFFFFLFSLSPPPSPRGTEPKRPFQALFFSLSKLARLFPFLSPPSLGGKKRVFRQHLFFFPSPLRPEPATCSFSPMDGARHSLSFFPLSSVFFFSFFPPGKSDKTDVR